jgi:hypothetical protein
MALVKCKECGNEISSQAKACPRCGRPSEIAETKKVSRVTGMAGLVVVGAIVVTVIGVNLDAGNNPKPQANAAPAVASVPATEAGAEATDDDKPMSPRETVQIYSAYVGSLQNVLFFSSMMSNRLMERLKGDFAFARQDAIQNDLELLRQQAASQSKQIQDVRPKRPIDEAEVEYFANASAAASELAADDAELVLDIAVGANYGSMDTEDMHRLGRSVHQKRQAFEAAVLNGYKHFGYKRGAINTGTLTLKMADPPEEADPAPVVTTVDRAQ